MPGPLRALRVPRNVAGIAGAALFAAAGVSLVFLLVVEIMQGRPDPYVGLFTYMVLPVMALVGLLLFGLGRILRNRAIARGEDAESITFFDFSHIENRQSILVITGLVAAAGVFSMSALGIRSIEYTESESFCGEVCHTVMSPEYTAYQYAPHANVSCASCHVGDGAGSFIAAKVRGMRQVWGVATDSFPRPIPTPIRMGSAEEICQACHWPNRDVGVKPVRRRYFLTEGFDEPWAIEMAVKVGGGTLESGFTEGAHWHMNLEGEVEYVATDPKLQEIAYVRWTTPERRQVEYFNVDMDEPEQFVEGAPLHRVDCLTCHNRPAHKFVTPVEALNQAFGNHTIDPGIPGVRWAALEALAGIYDTDQEARETIAETVRAGVADEDADWAEAHPAEIDAAVLAVQNLFGRTQFPVMKSDWRSYPNNNKHWNSNGCFRCHSGNMVSAEGEEISWACDTCHTILGQGRQHDGSWQYDPDGLQFVHPADEELMEGPVICTECHDGSLGY